MAISFRASTTFTAGNNTSIAAHGKPAGTAIGDVIVASMYIEATGLSPVIASTGDTWTLVHEITNTTPTPDMTHYVWVGVIGNASSTVGVTWGGGSFWADFTLNGFSGVDNATPQDAAATENSGTSTTPTALGIAEVTASSWLVMCETNFAGNASSGSTLTERHDNENVAVFAAASSSSANQTATITSSSWTAIMLRLRPAAVTTTRFYLPASGTAGASPTISADWEHSSGIRRPMSPTKGSTTLTSTAYTPDAADHLVSGDALHVQFVSDPLVAQTIAAQTIRISIKGLLAHASNAQGPAWKLFVWTAAGAVGPTLIAIRRGVAFTTSLINRADGTTSTGVTVGDGDRLVLEIGAGGTPTAAGGVQGHNASLRFGESGATDAPYDNASTVTTENPWLEFANTILFQAVFATTGSAAMRVRPRATISHVNSETVTYDDARYTYNHPTLTYDGGWAGVGVAAARIQARATIATVQPTFGTVAARAQTRATVTAGKASSASISARGTIRGAAVGLKARSLSVALRVGSRVTTSVTSASTATAALAARARLTGTAAAHATTTSIAARVAAWGSIFTGRPPSVVALRAAARVMATAAAVHTAVAAWRSRISAALAGTVARASASAGRTSLRLQAPSVTKASLGVVTIGGTAAAAAPTTLTSRLGLADLFGTARAATLSAPRAALGEANLQTTLRGQSDGLSEFTLYWPPATLLKPVHLGWAYRGDTLILPVWQAVDQRGNLISLEGATVWFTAKADLADTDAEPLTIQCSTLIGGVEIIDAALGSYQVIVPAGETQQLDEDTRFTFDVQVVTAIPTTHTVRRGTLIVVRDVTRSVA